ncbi:MAG: DNA polymerase III subunit beta [Bdellovibrionales bacterium CG10_big_fil_rev_8_21_14_0_10_45_34]|nr:MAG: DNA polymerase III subunit beta [Bdellovibrionales bacterium CG10_big_fil_rev_8_21_14_0_10_45_34]
MKIRVEKKRFLEMVTRGQALAERRTSMEVLSNLLLEAKDGRLNLFATDLEVSVTTSCPAEVEEPGRVAVDAKSIYQILRELSDDAPVVVTTKKNNWIDIEQLRSKFNIVGVAPEDYPIFPTFTTDDFEKISASILVEMVDKTIYSVSVDETRHHLTGVYLHKEEKPEGAIIRMVATDGHRLSFVEKNISTAAKSIPSEGVIVPRKGLSELRKLLEGHDEMADVAVEGSQLIVRFKDTLLMIRLIEGNFPDYRLLIPKTVKNHAKANRQELVSVLRRVSLLSNQKSKGVTMTFTDGNLNIASSSPELGDAKEDLPVNYEGTELKIGFNARYLLDVLNSMENPDVEIGVNDQVSPGVLRPESKNDYTCIVMPMRI